jgi:HK97 family phage prohead protease
MERAYSVLNVKDIREDADFYYIEGIASTPTPDRMGDVVEPMGAKFKLPMPLLWQHESKAPVGTLEFAKPNKSGIPYKARLPKVKEEGNLKARIEEAVQSIKYKLVAAVSIGFNAIDGAYERMTNGGYRFKEWEWLELSLVTIPANSEATITSIKSLCRESLVASGRMRLEQEKSPGVTGKSIKGSNMKTLQELREERTQKAARMSELLEVSDMDENEVSEFDSLETELKQLDLDIRKARFDYLNSGSANPVEGKSTSQGSRSRSPNIIVKGSDVDEKFQGQNYTRMIIAKALAHNAIMNGGFVSASQIAEARWGKSAPTMVALIKANEVAGGGSGSGEWGAELVSADNRYTGDFITYLTSRTVYDKLPLRQVPANVAIKGQDGTATGYWVGESKAIPVSKADFSTVSLTPLKVAAMAVVSNELLRDSSPAAEQLIRDALVDASAQRIDTTFLSTTAASSGVSPAGILNGLTPIASAGADAAGLRSDIKALYRNFITAKNVGGLQLVMHPSQAKALSLLVNSLGQTEFPGLNAEGGSLLGDPVVTGENVEGSFLILLKPSDIYRIGDTGVEVSMSREASIAQNSAPAGATDTPVGETEAWTSMFQEESTAIKVVRSINFAKRRSTAVAYVSNADYDGVES